MEEESNPDYETLSPYEAENIDDDNRSVLGSLRRPALSYIREHSNNSSSNSDYESISSLDLNYSRRKVDAVIYANMQSIDSTHDYESIDNLAITTSIDIDSLDSPPYVPDGAARNKVLKIDSHGYASVLYPHEEDDDWFDCLNQDRDQDDRDHLDRHHDRYQDRHHQERHHERHQDSRSQDSRPQDRLQDSPFSSTSNITVHNVEEAWRHQLVKGYAPLTMQQEPPPLFSRTRSAPIVPLVVAQRQAEPQDYEVPVHLMPPPPPPMIELRRISLLKQQQAAGSEGTDGHIRDVQEEEGSKGAVDESTVNEASSSVSQKDKSEDDASSQTESDDKFSMRSRIMTAPTLSFQTFTVAK